MSKYYKLVVAMIKDRYDWSEGYKNVTNELKNFKVENSIDQEIVDELTEVTKIKPYDGRHFRDCEHSYDWIIENFLTEKERKAINKGDL